ncbi:MAG TPA: bifunctional diaminohydroxyphosphoribosylaminopyrimidine deaminase/5-amino-6-(5-phosphoribosylamino)uracil reductase RibD [Burkholderiaceae bacterium]|nr:bifunctional diaminohydroxyphosphoribosylaminopyrimidine deaminase/5-amino-6-(5-phosphoribosylamino)uracil reductase RibD [Burkholderiaceae bacterium]
MFTEADHAFMSHALALAAEGLNTTTPNPRVGCVIVKDGNVIGEGFHRKAGEPHAEVHAILAARAKVGSAALVGATAYVTLEPCQHFGRTPPCVTALLEARISRVVAAMEDPNPLVAGQGLAALRQAGIDVRCGLLAAEAAEVNAGFISRMTRGIPWVRLKVAATLDGGIALADGTSQWITGEAARRDGHAWRARACAVLTGAGTVIEDDPQLTVRAVETSRQPMRVIVDSRLEVPPTARVFDGTVPTLVFVARAPGDKAAPLRDRGIEFVELPNAEGKVDLPAMLRELGRRNINELHIEAGGRLNASLLREGCVDELLAYYAPRLMGEGGRRMFDLPAPKALDDMVAFDHVRVATIGEDGDFRVLARLKRRGD